jgi:hypothetical protein
MLTQVGSETRHIVVKDVEFVPGFKRNLQSYVSLEKKGVRLQYNNERRYLLNKQGTKVAEVYSEGDILVVRDELSGALANAALVRSVVEGQEHVSDAVHEDTLYNWHTRFGHQSYDAIEALAAKPGSGIKLTDRLRPNCMICAKGKQTKNRQPKKENGTNLPIHRVGGVICSDLKGPITPVDREHNRYLINFVDHHTNYCRIFLAKTKDDAAKKFLNFVGRFEKDVLIAESKCYEPTGVANMRMSISSASVLV